MKRMLGIYRYIDKKYIWLVVLGRFINGGVVLIQPLVLSKILQLDQHGLSYGKIWQLLVYGLSVYFVVYSFMLLGNHSHNVFRREIQNGIRSSLFQKIIANPKYSQNDKITLLTQDMEVLGDRYLEPINCMISWGFTTLVTAIYILMQDLVLGAIFVVFTILRPLPQFFMNQRLKDTGKEYSDLRTRVHEEVADSVNGSETLLVNQSMRNSFQRVFAVMQDYQSVRRTHEENACNQFQVTCIFSKYFHFFYIQT